MIFPVSTTTFLLAPLALIIAITNAFPADPLPTRVPRRPNCPVGNPNPTYFVKEGDTPTNISIARKVSTINLLAVNRLNETSRLEFNQSLCIPPTCKVYQVKPGNTCSSIAKAAGLRLSRFYDHNPGIHNPECDNITPGTNVCLNQSSGSNFPMVRPSVIPKPGGG